MTELSVAIKRKEYMRGKYAKYWINARTEKYGFMDYDKYLIDLILNTLKADQEPKVLEVCIGTGWPIASSLIEHKYDVFGIDIAVELIAKCNVDWPDIRAEVGDAESLCYEENSFNFTYCVHSSWFLPDVPKVVSEMFRVTKKKGHILIDLMNLNNPSINKIYKQHVFENASFLGKVYKTIKNLAKLILQHGTQDWPFIVAQTPSDPVAIIEKCRELGCRKVNLYSWNESELEEVVVTQGQGYSDHARLVICCEL